jgi:hypothetical protein
MEVIDLGFESLDPISLNIDERPSVNFGIGAELLMNDKKLTSSSSKMNVDLGELDKLEMELNNLTSENESKKLSGFSTNFFGFGSNNETTTPLESVNIDTSFSEPANVRISIDELPSNTGLGQATSNAFSGFTKTFDGFSKMSDVPIEESQNKLSDREKRRKKRMMIKKLEEWYEKGIIKNSSNFNIDSNYDEIEDEYESAMEDKRRKDSIKLQQWWFITFVNSVEYANATFDPFDVNLDGWGEQVSEDIDSYEEIFSELYHKYKGGKLSPEISLLMRLGFSAAVVGFTNKALSSAAPGFNDVMRQSPELMKTFTNATVQAMSQKSPGFQFVNQVLNSDPPVNTSYGPPPVPMQTKIAPPSQRGGGPPAGSGMTYTTRPDINAARQDTSPMFRERGVDMNQNQGSEMRPSTRPEMRGPQNIDIQQLIGGLKPREIDIHHQQQQQQQPIEETNIPIFGSNIIYEDNESMISATSARSLSQSTNSKPKRTYRKKTSSDKNTISLDI